MDVFNYALLGLGPGAVYALSAQALVISHRVSGVINFAQCAIGSIGAYVYYEMNSRLGLPLWISLIVGVLAGALAGVLVQLLVMHPLRNSSTLSKMVGTLGVLTTILYVEQLIYGSDLKIVPAIFPTDVIHALGDVGADRLCLLGCGVLVTVGLGLLYSRTNFGRITSAVSENPTSSAAVGISPQYVALLNWGLGGAIGGLATILIAPLNGLHPSALGLVVLPALAAAVIGGFTSFPLVLAGGVLIGVLQSESSYWFPNTSGLPDALPFLVIIIVLAVKGRALPTRGDLVEKLPSIGTGRIRVVPLLIALVVGIVVIYSVELTWVDAITISILFGLLGLSSVVVVGYAGQLSLAQYMLAGLGGWAAARLVVNYGIAYELAFLAGVAVAMVAGLIAALPTMRTRGPALAIATLGLGVIIQSMLLGTTKWTGGSEGSPVGDLKLFGINFSSIMYPARYATLALIVLVLCALLVSNLRRGHAGRRMIAVRNNERAAAALGINVRWAKMYAFMISAGVAGLAGCLLAFRAPMADFASYDIVTSINVLAFQVIGGIGHVLGMVAGFGFAPGGVLQRPFASFENITLVLNIIGGGLLILTLILEPNGIAAGAGVKRLAHALRGVLGPVGAAGGKISAATVGRWNRSAGEQAGDLLASIADRTAERIEGRTLTAADIEVRYGNVRALSGVSLEVRPGEITALIGPNGAGKTTFIDTLTGFVKPAGGVVTLDGEPINNWSVAHRSRSGIGRSFQGLELFEDLTVAENLAVASDPASTRAWLVDPFWSRTPALDPDVLIAVRDLGLVEHLDRKPGDLSYGQRRLVAIARALAARPSVLMLDEPAAGLDRVESAELGAVIKRLAEEWGVGILLVEHDMDLVMKVSDRVVVINFGEQIADGTPQEVQSSPAVIDAYLGVDSDDDTADEALPIELVGSDEPAGSEVLLGGNVHSSVAVLDDASTLTTKKGGRS